MVSAEFPILAVPVFSQFIAICCVHSGYQFKCVECLSTGIDLFKNNTDCFLRRFGPERNDRHLIFLEVLKNFVFEGSKEFALLIKRIGAPMIIELFLPVIPVENARNWKHQVSIFKLRGRDVEDYRSTEVFSDTLVLG